MKSYDVIIPVYRPKKEFYANVVKLCRQNIRPEKIIIINTYVKGAPSAEVIADRLSRLESVQRSRVQLVVEDITPEEFDHGKTRNYGASKSSADFILFMTQDAVPADNKLAANLMKALSGKKNGAAYARQLPKKDASYLERVTRDYNYPDINIVRSLRDLQSVGIKAIFLSDVCAMYKKSIFDSLGGFVNKTTFNEDMIFAKKLLQAGYRTAYRSDARVYHSHSYSIGEQFRRSFDNGASHADYADVFKGISSEGEGMRYVFYVISRACGEKKYGIIPKFVIESAARYAGFFLGEHYRKLPKPIVKICAMNKRYFI